MDFNGQVELGFVCERSERRKAQNRVAQRKFRSKKGSSSGNTKVPPPSMEVNHQQPMIDESAATQDHSMNANSWIPRSSDPTIQNPPASTSSDLTPSLPLSSFTTSHEDTSCLWADHDFSNISPDMASFHLLGLPSPNPSPNMAPGNSSTIQFPPDAASWQTPARSTPVTHLLSDLRSSQMCYSHDDGGSSSSRSDGRGFPSGPGSIDHSVAMSANNPPSRASSVYNRIWSEPSSWNSQRPPPSEHQYSVGPSGSCSPGSRSGGRRSSPSIASERSGSSRRSELQDWNLPLHIAAEKGHESIVKALVDSGVDVNERDSAGCTALHIAVRYKQEGLLKILLENGADVNAQDVSGWTPVHTAADNGFSAGLRLLLEYGGSLTLKARKKKR